MSVIRYEKPISSSLKQIIINGKIPIRKNDIQRELAENYLFP